MESRRYAYFLIRKMILPYTKFILRTEVIGKRRVPSEGAAILVGPHRCDIDPWVISSVLHRYVSWVSVSYLAKVPVIRTLLGMVGTVFTNNTDGKGDIKSFREMINILESGEILGIFPEGHDYLIKSNFRAPMGRMYPGFAGLAYLTDTPVIPFLITAEKETVLPYPVPQLIRRLMKLPPNACNVQSRLSYRLVRVYFSEPIALEKIPGNSRRMIIENLIDKTKRNLKKLNAESLRIKNSSVKGRKNYEIF